MQKDNKGNTGMGEQSFSDKGWDGMQVLLDKHLPVNPNNDKRRLLWLILFLGLVLGGGFFFNYYMSSKNSIPDPTERPVNIEDKSETAEKDQNKKENGETGKDLNEIKDNPVSDLGRTEIPGYNPTKESKITPKVTIQPNSKPNKDNPGSGIITKSNPENELSHQESNNLDNHPVSPFVSPSPLIIDGLEKTFGQRYTYPQFRLTNYPYSLIADGKGFSPKTKKISEARIQEGIQNSMDKVTADFNRNNAKYGFTMLASAAGDLGFSGYFGPKLGLITRYQFGRKLGLQTGVSFSMLNVDPGLPIFGSSNIQADLEASFANFGDTTLGPSNVKRLDFLNVPLHLTVGLNNKFEFFGGPSFSYLVHAKRVNDNSSGIPVSGVGFNSGSVTGTTGFRKLDPAFEAGFNYYPSKAINLSLTYHQSFVDITKNEFFSSNKNNMLTGFQLGLNIRLFQTRPSF